MSGGVSGAGGRSRQEPVLGLSADPGRDIDEAIQELREEVERAQGRLREHDNNAGAKAKAKRDGDGDEGLAMKEGKKGI